jgi:DNA-binding transcriptional LysR family regulator
MLIFSGMFIGFLPEHFARPWVQDGQLRAIKPRTFQFSSVHNVAYRASDAERPLIRAFLASLASQPSSKTQRAAVVD